MSGKTTRYMTSNWTLYVYTYEFGGTVTEGMFI